MEEEFRLKFYCGFDKFEQALMTAEERKFHLDRIQEEYKKNNDAMTKDSPKGNPKFK